MKKHPTKPPTQPDQQVESAPQEVKRYGLGIQMERLIKEVILEEIEKNRQRAIQALYDKQIH